MKNKFKITWLTAVIVGSVIGIWIFSDHWWAGLFIVTAAIAGANVGKHYDDKDSVMNKKFRL